jgi:hypothetical protein
MDHEERPVPGLAHLRHEQLDGGVVTDPNQSFSEHSPSLPDTTKRLANRTRLPRGHDRNASTVHRVG